MAFDFAGPICNAAINYPGLRIVEETDRIPAYPHITFKVTSLSEYLVVIDFLHKCLEFPDDSLAFRGMSDYRYLLQPSLKVFQARKDFQYYSDENIENRLVDELLTTRPEEFAGLSTDFDILAKMQHLGLPTRLLDFSLNPLVALFFACRSQPEKIARVVCTYDFSSAVTKRTVDNVCSLYHVPEFAQYYIEDMVGRGSAISHYLTHTMDPLMAHPKCISERIRRQSGIFMIFPNEITDRAWYSITSWGDGHHVFPYNTIEGSKRIQAIQARENPYDLYAIDPPQNLMGFQFYLTNDSYRRLVQYYKEDISCDEPQAQSIFDSDVIHHGFEKRFEVSSHISDVSGEMMRNCFCSILIEPQHKSSILQELNQVNINEAFLFPEPEYTAKQIKNKYLY